MPETNMRCEACHEYERAFLTAIRDGVELRDENETLRARIAKLEQSRNSKRALDQEIRGVLLSRGLWVGSASSDLITAVARAIDATREDKPHE